MKPRKMKCNNIEGKKIALYIPTLAGGGAERMMLKTAQGFLDCGASVDLLLTRAEGGYLPLVPKGIRLIDFKSYKTFMDIPHVVRYLKKNRCDILISALRANIVALIAKKISRQKIMSIARIDNTLSMKYKGILSSIEWKTNKHLLPFADSIICVSHGVEEDLKTIAPNLMHLVKTIWNPVADSEVLQKSQAPLDHPWLFGENHIPVVLSVGRLIQVKNQSMLLKALADIIKIKPVRLIILGEGPDEKLLKQLACEMKIDRFVDFLGFRDNPFSYMAKSQVFVLSSYYEGLPSVLVEAMACGTPIVSTDCPSGPREILDNGRLGRLVPINDYKEMAKAIIETLKHPLKKSLLTERANQFSLGAYMNQMNGVP